MFEENRKGEKNQHLGKAVPPWEGRGKKKTESGLGGFGFKKLKRGGKEKTSLMRGASHTTCRWLKGTQAKKLFPRLKGRSTIQRRALSGKGAKGKV